MPVLPHFHRLHQASQQADQIFARQQSGLTPRQFAILVILNGKQGVSQTELTLLTGIDRSTMTELIIRLQRRRWIARRRVKGDRRTYAITLTPAGDQILANALPAAAITDRELLAVLSDPERAQFLTALDKILAALTRTRREDGLVLRVP